MFERFTEPARQVVVTAQEEARALKHNYVGTEHILLGLLREWDGLAHRVLDSLGITIQDVRAQVARIVGNGDEIAVGQIPFTPRTKRVLELSMSEARELGHNYIGTEHLLLGLVREKDGVAMQILQDLGADADRIESAVIELLSGQEPLEAPQRPPVSRATTHSVDQVVSPLSQLSPLALGWLLFGVSLGLGILIGWLIWG